MGQGFVRARRRIAAVVLAAAAAAGGGPGAGPREAAAVGTPLTTAEVTDLISASVHFANRFPGPPVTVAVVDVEGNSLGVFHMTGSAGCRAVALAKASTGSYFSSDFGSFTTRTAAFIIQDHFPPGLDFAPAGPLYGVEFSSLATTDVNPIYFPGPSPAATCLNEPSDLVALPEGAQARVRGELGGIGLYKGGLRVGGLGIDDGGDNRLTIPTDAILGTDPDYRITFRNLRRGRRLERIALSAGRDYLVPRNRSAVTINLDGIRLPFAAGKPRRPGGPVAPVVVGVDGTFDPDHPLRDAALLPSRFTPLTVNPPAGSPASAQPFDGTRPIAFPVVAGTDGLLTAAEVERILWQGAREANITRAAIRRPIGRAMQCWISVVDTAGEVLGVYRTPDATLFSYDVSVQKARTALLFSDAQAAWSTRGVGQFSQRFYPAGQQQTPHKGPLYQLQDGISVALLTGELGAPPDGRFRNGITIFPGGVPLYRDGVLVGAVGVSGDGVDQDDIACDSASAGFRAPGGIRCDALGPAAIRASLGRALDRIDAAAPAGPPGPGLDFFRTRLAEARTRLARVNLVTGPPYVKFPRHPGPVTVR
jgi:uncharacterized protein GlcG (DUF336 family)